VAPCRSDLEGAFGLALAANGREVGFELSRCRGRVSDDWNELALSAEMVDACLQRGSPEQLDPVRKRGLLRILDRHDQSPNPGAGEAPCHREDAGDGANRGIERKPAQEGEAVEPERLVFSPKDRDRDSQVECALFPSYAGCSGFTTNQATFAVFGAVPVPGCFVQVDRHLSRRSVRHRERARVDDADGRPGPTG